MSPERSCPGVLRVLGDGDDSCSLGRHCEANALRTDRAAYRRSHHRFSDPTRTASIDPGLPAPEAGGRASPEWREEPTLFELFADAMERLDEINPPTE